MMRPGVEIQVRVNGVRMTLTLDERVVIDPSCHQYENGWWGYDDGENPYFISDDGVVYGETQTAEGQLQAFSDSIGKVIA